MDHILGNKNIENAPLYEVIYEVLRSHLAEDKFPAGLVLGEASVARAFNTSRIPASAALRRLYEEGLVKNFKGRGYLAGPISADVVPKRIELADAGLDLPSSLAPGNAVRNRPKRLYPEVEHAVAISLAYGRFLLNESALAEYYGVSRSVTHEILIKLERAGLITQDSNQRWYAGPLTADLLREHFEIRWLLEPVALRQAAPKLNREDLEQKRDHLAQFNTKTPPARIERIEYELHHDIIGQCDNKLLRASVYRSQLPLLATHSTFVNYQNPGEITAMAVDHTLVFEQLIAGKVDAAAHTLEMHLRRSMGPNIELLLRLDTLPEGLKLPYLVQLEGIVRN